jgi:hypothetical protein
MRIAENAVTVSIGPTKSRNSRQMDARRCHHERYFALSAHPPIVSDDTVQLVVIEKSFDVHDDPEGSVDQQSAQLLHRRLKPA